MTAEATLPASQTLASLRAGLRDELIEGILPYWMHRAVDERHGGFAGLIGEDGRQVPGAPKGGILNARILWTFSAAYRALGDPAYRAMADRAAVYLAAHLTDPTHGGMFWMVDAVGRPLDDRKHVYAQAFAIYALAEHYRATGDEGSLRAAIAIFRLVEAHAHDAANGGYREAFDRRWVALDDVRLSDVDVNAPKSMNTHLHLLEAYATLLRAWPDPLLRRRLSELVDLFAGTIVGGRAHAQQFFEIDWTPVDAMISYGHDIETSWLMLDAADALGDAALRARAKAPAMRLAASALSEGFDREHGGLFTGIDSTGAKDADKEWWQQAEAIVGFVNAFAESGDDAYLEGARATWAFTRRYVRDAKGGEWHRRVSRDGQLRAGHEKVGPWKCPYHNARGCLEIMARVDARPSA
jgi:mannobiose 2-epimerase